MMLLALGINHGSASVELRERVVFAPETMSEALVMAIEEVKLEEVVILSTCNRTEIYAQSKGDPNTLLQWMADYHQMAPAELECHHYRYLGSEAMRHMMKVASGLDSLVLGEPQILGQMKSAFAVAQDAGTVGSGLHSAFQQVFSVAKRVRTETAIGENPVSVAYAAVGLAQQIFSNLREDTALLIGAGDTIELAIRHLKEKKIKRLIVANRTLSRAKALAADFGAEAILLADIPEYLHCADIVISSTASQLPILGKGAVESALKQRKRKPMFMVDIAVPRDIEAEVVELDDVYLFTVDDLKDVIDENRKSRREAATQADTIVHEGVISYENSLRALQATSTIKAYRQKAEVVRDEELEKALKLLENKVDPQQVVTRLARNLTNKLIHAPSVKLKKAGADGRDEVIGLTQELFDLHDQDISDTD